MLSFEPSAVSGDSIFSRRTAFSILIGIGGVLAGVLLLDAYVDWVHQGDPLWSTVLENSIPALLGLALPYAGWRILRSTSDFPYLPAVARWALIGSFGMMLLSGLVLGVHVLQEEIKPLIIAFQLASVGAVAGLWVGYSLAWVKETEQRAKEDRDRLANLLEGIPAPVVHGRFEEDRLDILRANAAFKEVFGQQVEEAEGRDLYAIVVPEEKREEAAEIDRQAIEEGLVNKEVRRLTSQGPRDFQLRVAQALDDGASETYAIYTDITNQKQRERELRLFKQVVEQANDAILVTEARPIDEPGPRIEYVNPAFEEMTGYDRQEIEGKTPRVLQGPETDRARLNAIRDALEKGKSWSGTTINYRKDGEPYHLRWSISPVRNENGEIEHWMSVQRDITDWKHRERELKRRSEAMDAASDGIAVLDGDGIYTYVNQAHADIYGYESPETFLDESWKMCYGEEELRRFESEVMPTLREEETWRGRAMGRRADGSKFPQELTLNVLDDGGVVCVVRDITGQIEREEEIKRAKQEAEEASQLKSAMLANMSHEIRTPLTSITGFSEMLKEGLEGQFEIYAMKIYEGSQRLQRTLGSVLQLSKLEAGVEELDREELSLQEIIGETVELFSPKAAEKSLTVSTDFAEGPVVGHWNKDAIYRICRNLLENAVKFTPEDGQIYVRVQTEDQEAILEVEDTGIGMNPDNVAELFKAFKQESEGLDREYEGSGLGLSIVKRLTKELGGDIEVDTEKGEGTCFAVHLPLSPPEESSTAE